MREIIGIHHEGKFQSPFYAWTVDKAEDIKVHANGRYPVKLIENARPSESDKIKKYRKEIWQPITSEPVNKVIASLEKIRKSDDWQVNYNGEIPSTVREGESLKDYMELKYPTFKSFTNYIFSYVFREYCLDANAYLLVKPINTEIPDNEYYRPFAFLFNSENILECTPEYCVIYSSEKVIYSDGKKDIEGSVYWYVDTQVCERYEQTSKKDITLVSTWVHDLGFIPMVGLQGQLIEQIDNRYKKLTRLYPMVARMNEAAREYSDLQAEVVQHVHTTRWYYGAQECMKCKGTGSIPVDKGAPTQCGVCKGKGQFPINPYEDYVLRMPDVGQGSIPTPPGGVFDKNTEIVKIQDERIDSHIFKALSSVNHEYLNKTPQVESGVAKIVDRTELHNFVYSVAEDIVRIMDEVYYITNEIRYKESVKEKDRIGMLPSIPVPTKYDIITESEYVQNYDAAKKAGLTPELIVQYEREVIEKKFAYSPGVRDKMVLGLELDRLAGTEEDIILDRLSQGVVSELDYYIHANIMWLIDEAMKLNKNFKELETSEQYAIITGLAESNRQTN